MVVWLGDCGMTVTWPDFIKLASPALPMTPTSRRCGKAPPNGEFSGEDLECQLDDWLPSLERARTWNAWTAKEKLMQLAGHLKG